MILMGGTSAGGVDRSVCRSARLEVDNVVVRDFQHFTTKAAPPPDARQQIDEPVKSLPAVDKPVLTVLDEIIILADRSLHRFFVFEIDVAVVAPDRAVRLEDRVVEQLHGYGRGQRLRPYFAAVEILLSAHRCDMDDFIAQR